MWDFDEFEGGFVHAFFEITVAIPVGVGFFDDDVSFEEETFEHFGDVEFVELGFFGTDGDVFEVTEDGHDVGAFFGIRHGRKVMMECEWTRAEFKKWGCV